MRADPAIRGCDQGPVGMIVWARELMGIGAVLEAVQRVDLFPRPRRSDDVIHLPYPRGAHIRSTLRAHPECAAPIPAGCPRCPSLVCRKETARQGHKRAGRSSLMLS